MSRVFIYGLLDPRSGELRYIGKTNDLKRRINAHFVPANLLTKSHKSNWLRELRHIGIKPEMIEIETVSVSEWENAEIFWIAYFKSVGCNLTNACAGGRGTAKPDDATRRKISERLRGRQISPQSIAVTIARNKSAEFWTPAVRKSAGEAQKRRFATSGHPSVGRVTSKRCRAAVSAANKRRDNSDETRKKLAAACRKRNASHGLPENRKRYVVISPAGERIEIFGLHPFCREYGLDSGTMNKIANGRTKQVTHKGWGCEKVSSSP